MRPLRTRSHAVLNATWHASRQANFLSSAALRSGDVNRESKMHARCHLKAAHAPHAARLAVLLARKLGADVNAGLALLARSVRKDTPRLRQRQPVLLRCERASALRNTHT